jgi:hypothetical protein
MNSNRQPTLLERAPDDVFYVESSVPPGMTISEYRRSRPRRPTRWERLKQLAGGPGFAAAQAA